MKYNQTLIKAYDCPRRGHLLQQLMEAGQRTPSSPAATVGSAVHKFIARYLKHCMEVGELTDLGRAEELKIEVAGEFPTTLDYQDYAGIVDSFTAAEVAPSDGAVWLEAHLETDEYHGTVDKVTIHSEDFVTIEDWKTDRRIRTLGEVESDFQLKFYAWLYLQTTEEELWPEVIELVMVFIRYGHPISYELSTLEVREFGMVVDERVKRIEGLTEFKAVPGDPCKYCEFAGDCPSVLEGIITGDNAQGMAERLKVVDKVRDDLTDSLKEWISKNGPVTVGNEALGYHESESLTWPDADAVIGLLTNYGVGLVDTISCFSITPTALKKICKGVDEGDVLWADLEEIGKTKKKTTFGFKKVGE